MSYRWILHVFLISLVKGIHFDNGFVVKTNSKLVKDKTIVDLVLNFTEPLIVMPNMTCNEKNITNEVNAINEQLGNDFQQFVHSLDLKIPSRWKFINHFCNCWGEKPWDHMGDPRLACCVDNKKDVRQLEHCTHDLSKRVHWDNKDMDSLISMCIRLPIPYFLQIFHEDFLNNLDLSDYSRKILRVNGYKTMNNDAPDFEFDYYQSGIKPYIPYNVERLLDHNLDTYEIFPIEKSEYFVNYTFTATWLANPGYQTVIVVIGKLSSEKSSSFQLQNRMQLEVCSNQLPCSLYDKNLFEDYQEFVDFYTLIFECPKRKVDIINVSFRITNFSKRIHEIAIIRNSPKQVVNVYSQNLIYRYNDYKANGDQLLAKTPLDPLVEIRDTEDANDEVIEVTTKPSVDSIERRQFFENVVNQATNEDEESNSELPMSPPITVKGLTNTETLPLAPPFAVPANGLEDSPPESDLLYPELVIPEYDILTDDEDLDHFDPNISYVDSSGYMDIDEWVALNDNRQSIVNASRFKRSLFRKISNFVHYWSTLGPITNLYNSDRMDVSDLKIEKIADLVENNSNMILHLDTVVKQQTKLLESAICESDSEIQLNFLELRASLAFLEIRSEIIEVIDQCRNKKLPLVIAKKFISDNCLVDCEELISCEELGLGLQLTNQRQLHIHLKIAVPNKNSAEIFRILPSESQLFPRSLSYIPNIEAKSFKMVTSQVLNLPENIVIQNNKLLGGFDGNDNLVSISKLKPTCLILNGTLLTSEFCDNIRIRYRKENCVVNDIPELNLVQIISLNSIRIFDGKNRATKRDCRKSCFIKPKWFTPDCFEWLVVNNNTEKFSTFNFSSSIGKLVLFRNEKFLQALEKNFSEILESKNREDFVKNIHDISKPIKNNWDNIRLCLYILASLIGTTILILVIYYGFQVYLKQFRQNSIFDIRRIQ